MKTLRKGSSGEMVERWQNFLIGLGSEIVADGVFGPNTRAATIDFQRKNGLIADGIVGNRTYGKAMHLGFEVIEDDDDASEESAAWPPAPDFYSPGDDDRFKMFGQFKYKRAPKGNNRERIEVTDNWDKENIVKVHVPQIKGLKYYSRIHDGNILFNKKAAKQMLDLWAAWEKAGLLNLILTWNGSYSPRLIRGSDSKLSNHAFGTAFDINVKWNMLGQRPALVGQEGSVRKLVPIANQHGFYWGGHYRRRKDGMHFEIAKLL